MIQCKLSSCTDLQSFEVTWQTDYHHCCVYEYLAIFSLGHTEKTRSHMTQIEYYPLKAGVDLTNDVLTGLQDL